MSKAHLDYNQLASQYHRRYETNPLRGVAAALTATAQRVRPTRMLEVGCGTGRWLAELQTIVPHVVGIDLALGMLQQARTQLAHVPLSCARAEQLPFAAASFDLIICVNAMHHFTEPQCFIAEAHRLLRRGGALMLIGMDPHSHQHRWFLYDYFEGTRELDLRRYASAGTLLDWLIAAGFARAEWRIAERIRHEHVGREVLRDHFVQKHGTSQLALLSDAAYDAGLQKLQRAIDAAEARGQPLRLIIDIPMSLLCAFVDDSQSNPEGTG